MVQKRSGIIEDFDYEKLYKGIDNAFGGLDINDKKLKTLVDNIHNEIKDHGNKVKTEIIGETVLSNLKETNKVAYLRFASVYKEFSDASDFVTVVLAELITSPFESNAFQLITNPLFSKRVLRSLKISFKSEN